MKHSRWFRESVPIIRAALEAARARGLDRRGIMLAVADAYPYGERALWPYRMWCAARRYVFGLEGLTDADPRRPAERLTFGVHDAAGRRRGPPA